MQHEDTSKIIIQGVTNDGQKFRPSDWAERMSGSLSTFKNHRIYYSPLLQPSLQGDHKCLLLDERLKESNPELFNQILSFARVNDLQICAKDEDTSSP